MLKWVVVGVSFLSFSDLFFPIHVQADPKDCKQIGGVYNIELKEKNGQPVPLDQVDHKKLEITQVDCQQITFRLTSQDSVVSQQTFPADQKLRTNGADENKGDVISPSNREGSAENDTKIYSLKAAFPAKNGYRFVNTKVDVGIPSTPSSSSGIIALFNGLVGNREPASTGRPWKDSIELITVGKIQQGDSNKGPELLNYKMEFAGSVDQPDKANSMLYVQTL